VSILGPSPSPAKKKQKKRKEERKMKEGEKKGRTEACNLLQKTAHNNNLCKI
jgi:hypothetical protein